MAKRTLYQILGVAEDASAEEMQHAYVARRQALSDEFEGEDRRNYLSFVDHAREVLADPQRRAAYDRQQRTPPADQETPQATPRQSRKTLAGLLLAAAVVLLIGRQFLTQADSIAPAMQAKATAPTPAAKPVVTDDLPSVDEAAAALLPGVPGVPDPGAAPPSAVPAAPPAAKAAAPRVVAALPGSPLMNRILESTYAIVGSQGLGTGVAVEADRLLTNCHVIAPNVLKGKIHAISPVTGASFEITEAAFLVREDACVVHAPGLSARPIPLGDTARLQRGARLHNIGFGDGKLTLAEGQYVGSLVRFGQSYMVSTNLCIPGVSGGPLVDDDGRLVGLTSGGARDSRGNNLCASLTVETARMVLSERMMQIDAFPTNYVTNWTGRR